MKPDQVSLFDAQDGSFFERLRQLELRNPTVDFCIPWLDRAKLTVPFREYVELERTSGTAKRDLTTLMGVPVHECRPKSGEDLKMLKKAYAGQPIPGVDLKRPETVQRLWEDYKSGRNRVLDLEVNPVPLDAIACYWPFHLDAGRWGIYLSVPALLEYEEQLSKVCSRSSFLSNQESRLRCVLFEIFHHEFFHHVVESTVTSLEIISAAFGRAAPLYLAYKRHEYEKRLGKHPHRPLEEALANAYAYNSFSFISRVKLGYIAGEAKLFQAVLAKTWCRQGPGYRDAGSYSAERKDNEGYVAGAAQLTAMMLNSVEVDPASLTLLARKVMPRGHTAFCEKAMVPTFLIGSPSEVKWLLEKVPAINETYTTLFWHRDTTQVDGALQEMKRAEALDKSRRR